MPPRRRFLMKSMQRASFNQICHMLVLIEIIQILFSLCINFIMTSALDFICKCISYFNSNLRLTKQSVRITSLYFIVSDRILMMKTLYCYYSKEVVIIYRMIGLRAELA